MNIKLIVHRYVLERLIPQVMHNWETFGAVQTTQEVITIIEFSSHEVTQIGDVETERRKQTWRAPSKEKKQFLGT